MEKFIENRIDPFAFEEARILLKKKKYKDINLKKDIGISEL